MKYMFWESNIIPYRFSKHWDISNVKNSDCFYLSEPLNIVKSLDEF